MEEVDVWDSLQTMVDPAKNTLKILSYLKPIASKQGSINYFEGSRIIENFQKHPKSLVSNSLISGKSIQNLEKAACAINFYY